MSSSEKKRTELYAWIENGQLHINPKGISQKVGDPESEIIFTIDSGKVSLVSNGNDVINPEVTIVRVYSTTRSKGAQELSLKKLIGLLTEALTPALQQREFYIIDGEETPLRSSCITQFVQRQVLSIGAEPLTPIHQQREDYIIDGEETPLRSSCSKQSRLKFTNTKVPQDRSAYQIDGPKSGNHYLQTEEMSEVPQDRSAYQIDGPESGNHYLQTEEMSEKMNLKYKEHNPNNEYVDSYRQHAHLSEKRRKLSGIKDISISPREKVGSKREQQYTHDYFKELVNKSQTTRNVDEKSCGDASRSKGKYHDTKKSSMALVSTSTVDAREAPGGWEDTNRSSGDGTNIGQGDGQGMSSSQYQTFMRFWRLDFSGESRQRLSVALDEPVKTEPGIQSTIFLLDTSESMREDDIERMKNFVVQILNDADEVREVERERDAKEAFGLAVFGRDTKIIYSPTTDYRCIKNCLDTLRTGGRSPLGLGLILCTSVWFGYQGLQGTIWIHGRKVHPRIIVITDMKPNETISEYDRDREYENDDLENISQVNVELFRIALLLGKLEIPVFMIPVGKNQEHYKKSLEPIIRRTGGCVIDATERVHLLGRHAWYQRLACLALQQLGDDVMQNEDRDLVEAITPYGNEEDRREVLQIIADRSSYEANGVLPTPVPVNIAGEPGEQFWRELPLGTRVQCPTVSCSRVGTVVAHAPNYHIIVCWDKEEKHSSFEIDQLRSVPIYRRPKGSENQNIQLLIGCKVRRVHRSDASMSEGTVVGVATLQNNVLYVSWSDGNVGRHSYPDQIEGCEPAAVWRHSIKGNLQQFDSECNDILEDAYIAESKTKLLNFEEKQYRAIFRTKKIRQLFQPFEEFDLLRDPPY